MAMWTKKCTLWRYILCSLLIVGTLALCSQGVSADEDIPSESQCRPYIEKALKDLESGDSHSAESDSKEVEQADGGSEEDNKGEAADEDSSVEILTEEAGDSAEVADEPSVEVADEPYVDEAEVISEDSKESAEDVQGDAEDDSSSSSSSDSSKEEEGDEEADQGDNNASAEDTQIDDVEDASAETKEDDSEADNKSGESSEKSEEAEEVEEEETGRGKRDTEQVDSKEDDSETKDGSSEEKADDSNESDSKESDDSGEKADSGEKVESDSDSSKEEADADSKEEADTVEEDDSKEDSSKEDSSKEDTKEESSKEDSSKEDSSKEDSSKEDTKEDASEEEVKEDVSKDDTEEDEVKEGEEAVEEKEESVEKQDEVVEEKVEKEEAPEVEAEDSGSDKGSETETDSDDSNELPENDLLMEIDIPENLRSREHISQLLRLDEESTERELTIEKSADITLRELKRLYDTAIKPLEILYKYRDLSNRHFGDPEIFSKPLILFMGPWSGGKSSLVNYLTDNEFTEWSLRTGAEPSPAYFNILMHGPEPQVLDGTQLAADWTFSGLQKFGEGLEERLRGLRLPNKLLEKVNIVEIPGILEVRKQVSRVFPFNDACQWFIDRADVIFLVYDPSKLDVGPETEAILDQLKGREAQTRIILNKADQVKPEELMRVQSALIWNISPLMSSAQPPVMYTTSLWSMPYEVGAPARLLHSQERSFLRDLRTAIDRRVENKIASARRFAVRVRNHAKMVDCYLTTYYNHKTIFGNKKVVAEAIIEHPQNYHIYEGLSTLTNISRYDLPDPETYRDFFRLNPLYEFQQLAATCTYFRGCPINRLDVAIAYDLPELVGKYKKMVESSTPQGMPKS